MGRHAIAVDIAAPREQVFDLFVNLRPSHHLTKVGNWFLRGENEGTFTELDVGKETRLTQKFRTNGIIPAITSWIFAHGSYKGSFRGELNTFKAICEREAAKGEKVGAL